MKRMTFLNLNLKCFLAVSVVCLFSQNVILAQKSEIFSVGGIKAKAGEKVSGKLFIETGINNDTIFIPITIINGVNSGPVLTLHAGVHGTEYVPVITLQKLAREISPQDVKGTLIMVHIANTPAFNARAVYKSPIDNKNLNRIFPGNKTGTISEKIAYTITNEISRKSDYFIDLHGGEFNERLIDYSYYYYGCANQDLCENSKLLAHAMGNRYLIPFDITTMPDSVQSQYSDVEALRQGAASMIVEWGDEGKVTKEKIAQAKNGIINVMRTLGMLEGKPFVNKHPVYLDNLQNIVSNVNGTLGILVERGERVTKGALLGYTNDYWGNLLEKYYSPISGIVITVVVGPCINKGEDVCILAEIKKHKR